MLSHSSPKTKRTERGSPPAKHKELRKTVPPAAIKELSQIPGIGPSLAADLYLLGVKEVADLQGLDAQQLYQKAIDFMGIPVDPCVLYTFRCAIYFASEKNPDPEKLKWWNWKDGN